MIEELSANLFLSYFHLYVENKHISMSGLPPFCPPAPLRSIAQCMLKNHV